MKHTYDLHTEMAHVDVSVLYVDQNQFEETLELDIEVSKANLSLEESKLLGL